MVYIKNSSLQYAQVINAPRAFAMPPPPLRTIRSPAVGSSRLRGVSLFLLPFLALLALATLSTAGEEESIVIDRDEIRALKVQRIADILNTVPGVRAGDTTVSIRGSSRVRVLLDGRPINDPTSSHGRINFDFISPDAIERIEILPGRGGLRYGDDASGGVILITSRSTGRVRGGLKFYGGSENRGYASGEISLTRGAWTVDSALGAERTDGYQVNDDRTKRRIRARLAHAGETIRSSLLFNALEDERGIPGRPEYPTPLARKQRQMFSSALSLKADSWSSDTFLNRADTANTNPQRDLDTTITVTELGEDLNTTFRPRPWGTVSAGFGGRWGRADASGFTTSEEHSLFLFLADTWSSSRLPLQLSAGLRSTAYSSFAGTVNPECRITLGKDTGRISLSWTRSSNTPSFYQRFSETSTRLPNPDLDMETADNLALSLGTAEDNAWSLHLTLFHNRTRDRITYVLADTGLGRYENFGRVIYRGMDLQLSWQPSGPLSIRTAYSYLHAIDRESGLWLTAKPRHRMNTDLEYRAAVLPLATILNIRYESRQATRSDNTTWAPARWLFGIRTEYHRNGIRFFAEIRNLANITYLYGDGSLAPPRTWLAGIGLNF